MAIPRRPILGVGGGISHGFNFAVIVGNRPDELRKPQITFDFQRIHAEPFFAPIVVEANDLEVADKGVHIG